MKKLIVLLAVLSLNYETLPSLFASPAPKFETANINFDEGTKIKLTIGGKTYELQSYSLSYVPGSGDKAKSETVVMSYAPTNSLNFNIKQSKVDSEFLDWIINPDQQPKDGQIVVTDGDTGKVLRTITFGGAKTQSYNENMFIQNYNNGQFVGFNLRYKTISIKF
ncbi:type VI secretion system tube protein TssD [Mucilaginibacter sp.]|uniref:type VI secretion system tube protein TssD n=1 Tax=Mucilaginibacter sp. TaxID=1882438 RepID=UPI0035BC6406